MLLTDAKKNFGDKCNQNISIQIILIIVYLRNWLQVMFSKKY